ncbi:transglycosylase SLT domain-containing protein [Marinobacterium sp. BA1]|uniref:transglycosylase SLT domain-containing protein n=1 Tax=Marinobacterium sp. BA1 TaxID=3138931 RepID=UPI0034E8D066
MLLRSILAAVLSVCVCSSAWSSGFPDQYDLKIRQAAKRYLPGYDWRLWKAQLFQESRLKPDAVSPVGARGLAQFMPGTWAEVSQQLGYSGISPHASGPAITAGAYYQGRMISIWKAERPAADRYSLAAASYNAGAGNIIEAQRVAGGANDYASIIQALPQVTGHHARETTTYVERIWTYWQQMVLRR